MARQIPWQSRDLSRRFARALDVLTTAAVMGGLLSVALEYGYHAPPLPLVFLRACQYGATVIFLSAVVGRFLLAEGNRDFFGRFRADLVLAGLLVLGLVVQWLSRRAGWVAPPVSRPGHLFVLQLYIGSQFVLHALRLDMALLHSQVRPARLLLASFLVFILLGAAALRLPRSVADGANPLTLTDAVFTSTSATCVTGLVVRATGSDQILGLPAHLADGDLAPAGFSRLGQLVILVLIQVGGLGVMIFGTILALLLGRQLSLRQGIAMQDMLSGQTLGRIGRIVKFIFLATFTMEAIGAALLYTMYAGFDWPQGTRLFFAVFHSVSAFCNAGFSLMPDSLVRYHGYWQVHGVIAPLIVLGGLGFPVLMNIRELLGQQARRLLGRAGAPARIARLTLHSRLVLSTSGILILGGAVGLLLMESPLTGRSRPGARVGSQMPSSSVRQLAGEEQAQPDPHRLRLESAGASLADALFMSLTARTAGFNTVRTDHASRSLSTGSYVLLMWLMIVGGSPASTAGGMKTVVFAVLVVTVVSVVRRREEVEGFKRSLPVDIIKRAATVAVCYLGLVFLVTLLLTITESSHNPGLMQLLFESASGCGTVGLSTGLTGSLTTAGRYVIILGMFAGRLGPLTLLFAMTQRARVTRYHLPHESVVLG